jgi:outer membrane protein assembly factor BamD (BamD/ComL family)
MARISNGSKRVGKQLFIFSGMFALLQILLTSSELAASETPTNAQNPPDQALQAAPKLPLEPEFQGAPTLFRLGRFAEAERQFAWIAAVRPGTSWGERGQYYVAECQFQQKKYFAALKSFERLHTDYPATGYLDKLVERQYEIAKLWLVQSDPSISADKKLPWIARLDGRLPLFGTRKWALQALEHVRQNEPCGPLADDANIQIADYYMRHQEFETAALYCAQAVTDYPKSPFRLYGRISAIYARIRQCLER